MAKSKKTRETSAAPTSDVDPIPTPETGEDQLDSVAAQDPAELAPQSDAAEPETDDEPAAAPSVAESEASQADVDDGEPVPDRPVSATMDIPFCAAVIGIPTGNFQSRIARFNATEIEQLTEASIAGNRQMVTAVFANATNRLNKPTIPLGKKQKAG